MCKFKNLASREEVSNKMKKITYRQYQFVLPSDHVDSDFVAELADSVGLAFNAEDYDDHWFDRSKSHPYLIREYKKDPNVFFLIIIREEYLVIRFKKMDEERVKDVINHLWNTGSIKKYASGQKGPDFSNKLHDPKHDWVPKLAKQFHLDGL
ncbi:hypothetical protein EDC32_101644 [Laceyella sacchari]|uniref:hypothetical protein n=1 Tax=Laceyella sacchari TaxID=37482 RepID=UPI0010530C10|nr:hypothetical protein [Laceyella sacchari]TCW40988.1 hypothetical protein EDC32_101644 [Laceyella sacchari]